MRALIVEEFAPYGEHAIKDLPDPEPGPGEVIIDTKAMSLNFPDMLTMEGNYQYKPERPFIPGVDASGVIGALGSGVQEFAVGDRVLFSGRKGAFSTHIQAPVDTCIKIPDAMSFPDAAAFALVYVTAYVSMTTNAHAKAGERVLITGASGGVGLAMVQYAKALGMTVLAGTTSTEKAQLAEANGADHTIDLAADNLRDSLREQVYAVTDGQGVDLVMDQVGGDVFDACLRAVAPGGRIAIVGFASGRIATVKTNYLLLKRLTVLGSPLTSGFGDGQDPRMGAMAEMLDLYAAGKLKPHISATYALDDWKTALARFKDRTVTGKIVLLP